MSSKPNDGGPAFPQPFIYEPNKGQCGQYTQAFEIGCGGMSLRAWLAGMAMLGSMPAVISGQVTAENAVKDNCYMADLQIAELEKERP